MIAFLNLLFLITLSTPTKADLFEVPNIPENRTDVLESWIKLDKTLKGGTQSLIKSLMPMVLESSSKLNLSSECVKECFQLVAGLKSLKKWAFSFVDATGKSFDGILSGTMTSFGEFDQCLETVVHIKQKDDIPIQATEKLHVDAEVAHCETKQKERLLLRIQIFAIICISFLACLVFLGTWIEAHSVSKSDHSKLYRILLSFSMISNFKRLFNTKTSMENFSCIQGMRVFTTSWIVIAHVYFCGAYFRMFYRTVFHGHAAAKEPIVQMIVNGSEAVDTFLFMAGMLVCYFTVKLVKIQKKKFHFGLFVLHRLWRIIPVYYFILLCATLVPLMGSGPAFHDVMSKFVYPCFRYWWRNALFIHNFYDTTNACMLHTWYISVDLQLYLLSLVVVLPILWSKRIGIFLNILIVVISVVYSGIVTHLNNLQPTITVMHVDIEEQLNDERGTNLFYLYAYANVLSRAGPYFIGVLTGYILVTKPDIKIPKKILVVGWILAALSSASVVFATGFWYRVHRPSAFETLLYAAFYKVAFTGGVAWMTFCCITGHGGIINKILSWKVWRPMGKLTFLIYLIHPILQVSYIANFRTIQEFTHIQLILQGFGYFVMSMLLAVICNLLVESPFANLEKIIFNMEFKREEKEETKEKINLGFENDIITIKMQKITQESPIEKDLDYKDIVQTKIIDQS
ncbi:nose resistant to fluoxetine protein 6 [Nephila pilipes]|uniref:Nose resistant to fluoxetine protein 6 n=1 Tax=Nephila pilipes TaxID=299642 RepID=A0A8X6NHN9_NEPPI|nr:nose resistant to fluoxetine protein 6 [Nephila pilipes]